MQDTSSWMILLRTALSLGGVLALIYAVAWIARRYFHIDKIGLGGHGDLRISKSLHLDSKKKIIVVEAEGRRLMLGVAESQITTLCDLGPARMEKTHEQSMAV